jgi:signal transduction histidine kinase
MAHRARPASADEPDMTAAIEPGILPLFRIFVALEILLLLLRIALEATFRADFPLVPSPWPALLVLGLLLAYLCVPALERKLGRVYLPSALVVSVALTMIGAAAGMKLRVDAGIRAEELVRGTWVLIVVLLVPLILVAWQYGLRWVLWFCLLTVAAEVALTLPLAARGGVLSLTLMVVALVRCLFFLVVGLAVAQLAQAQRRQRAALAQANARLARYAATLEQLAVSRERNRLAYELHDTLAHGLSGLAVQLEAMSVLWSSRPETARSMLAEALAGTRTALGEARRAIAALRARPLEELGLARAVRDAAESTACQAGLLLDLHVPSSLEGLSKDTEHAIYRIAAEALANVARHARARRLTVQLEQSKLDASLTIADDGRGFDPAAACGEQCFGLSGMHERAGLIGGELVLESAPGKGTTVRLTLRRHDDTRPDL